MQIADFDEGKHPRSPDGKFTSGGGSQPKQAPQAKPRKTFSLAELMPKKTEREIKPTTKPKNFYGEHTLKGTAQELNKWGNERSAAWKQFMFNPTRKNWHTVQKQYIDNPVDADPVQDEDPTEDGGPGSGNWGHKGRIGKRGGSGKGGGTHYREGSKETGFNKQSPKMRTLTDVVSKIDPVDIATATDPIDLATRLDPGMWSQIKKAGASWDELYDHAKKTGKKPEIIDDGKHKPYYKPNIHGKPEDMPTKFGKTPKNIGFKFVTGKSFAAEAGEDGNIQINIDQLDYIDDSTLVHEWAHQITSANPSFGEQVLKNPGGLFGKYVTMIDGTQGFIDGPSYTPEESFADGFGMFYTNPDKLKKHFPEMFKYYERFDKDNPEIRESIAEYLDAAHEAISENVASEATNIEPEYAIMESKPKWSSLDNSQKLSRLNSVKKKLGFYGDMVVPPKHIDASTFFFDEQHVVARKHGVTKDDALRFIE